LLLAYNDFMKNISNLEWMMWRIDKKNKNEPPLLNLVQAIEYYVEKYGKVPNRCEINENWGDELIAPAGMLLTRSKGMIVGHLMLTLDAELSEKALLSAGND
jgi:hypothetical protein